MQRTRLVARFLTMAICAASVCSQLAAGTCEKNSLPLTYGGPLGHFKNVILQTNARAEGKVEYENTQSIGLIGVTFLIDYFNRKHERLFTLIYHAGAGTDNGSREFFQRQLPLTVGDLKGSLGAGQSIEVLGSSPFTSTDCPVEGQVTLVHAVFEGGTTSSWSTSDWHLDPDVTSGPAHLELSASLIFGRSQFFASAKIDQNGKLKELTTRDQLGPVILSKLRDQIALLTFQPAMIGGRTVDGSVTLLFRFHQNPSSGPLSELGAVNQKTPFGVLDFLFDSFFA